VSTDLLYSQTETDLRNALRDLLADQASPDRVRALLESPETADADLWHTVAADIGVAGLLIPESLGGAGASYRELATAAEEFGAAAAPVPYLGSAAVATAALLSAARASASRDNESEPPSPAAHLLKQLADGGLTAALAVDFSAWPGGPHGPTARVSADRPGDAANGVTRLRGTIPAVADALLADVLLVPADGVPEALYVVETNAPGVHRTPVVSLDMTRQLCDITLDDAPVRRVAGGAAAEAAITAGLNAGAAILAAEQLGLAQRCLDMTVAYVKERHQFARPVGSFQALKHRLADVWTAITQARAASRYAAACLADEEPAAPGGNAPGGDGPVAVALAKSTCSEVAVLAAEECVQLHGGIGFTWEHPAHVYLKRAKASSVGFGSAGAHRSALAALVNLPAPS
jgi:alkylation response protein AidB-like acyl-CoA dehydrogenase